MTELLFSDKFENSQRNSQMQTTRWSFCHSVATLLATFASMSLQSAWPLIVVSAVSFVCLWGNHFSLLKQQSFFAGPANWVTALRFVIVSYVLMFFQVLPQTLIISLLTIAVLMDVFDGFIARRTNSQSEFGALFDMEVDAFYVLAMGLYFWFTTDFGWWLLIPGGIRYAYEIIRILFVGDGFIPKRQALAVFLAGFNFVLLLVALVVPSDTALLVLLISLAVVCFSFGRSFFDMFRYVIRQGV